MTTFVTPVQVTPVDPTKHVNFTLGMVLGVDDMNQQFAYTSERQQWYARDLLGYGTVSGLQVTTPPDNNRARVLVAPGTAVVQSGELVRVPTAQCAYLDDWLTTNQQQLLPYIALSPPSNMVTLYIVLCYRACPTDPVPIAGEPCRSADEATAPSRLTDDFQLTLSFTPPAQPEEDGLRGLVGWLRAVTITPMASTPLDDFLNTLRMAMTPPLGSPPGSPPDSPPFFVGSPPTYLQINANDICDYLHAAFRVWVTELRPLWRPDWLGSLTQCTSASGVNATPIPDADCVLLAALDVPLTLVSSTNMWQVADPTVIVVREDQRPYVIHLRLLQEWVTCGYGGESSAEGIELQGDVTGQVTDTTVVAIQHVPVAVASPPGPGTGQVLTFNGTEWAPENLPALPLPGPVVAATTFGLSPSDGSSAEFSHADHVHGTPPAPPEVTPADAVTSEVAFGQAPNAGTSVEYSRADHTHGTPPAPPAITPGPVVAATTFGLASSDGESAEFSRADHVHGTPPAPPALAPGRVVPETVFGLASADGVSAEYSHADHAHGTPPDPIPMHRAAADAHTLARDVTGTTGDTTVVAIQHFQVATSAPAAGQVLTYDGAQWAPANPVAGAGPYVEHPPAAGSYFIVAAGLVKVGGPPGYNNLTVTPKPVAPSMAGLLCHFDGYARGAPYIVKALPVFNPEFHRPLVVNFVTFEPDGFVLGVSTLQGEPPPVDVVEVMVEVSMYR